MAEAASHPAVAGRWQRGLLTLLRIAIGWHFLYEGHAKFMQGHWTSAGYLDASRWWFGGVFQWMAAHPAVITLVDAVNIGGQVVIGLLLITGTVARAASLAGVALLLLYYLANPPLVGLGLNVPADGHYLVVDRNLIEALTLAFLAALPATALPGVDRWFLARRREAVAEAAAADEPPSGEPAGPTAGPARADAPDRRAMLANLASLPFLGAFVYALVKQHRWQSYEEKNLVDAVTAASARTLDVVSLRELKGRLPMGRIGGKPFSRLILGGNLLSGWAHSRDLIYVSQLVKAYHNKDRIFATLLVAEKCGVNTLLTNPILCSLIDEYWKRRIGRIQFISDCAGLEYDDKGPHPMAFDKYLAKVQRAIDYGAVACYIQGETADYYMKNGQPQRLARVIETIRRNKVLVGIGAHQLETVQGCVAADMVPDFWMKTLHHHGYWSARHPEWHDNLYCSNPEETTAWMAGRREPWIAFKVMAAGAIHPKEAFRYAFERGADFVCAGMYDFQMVEDVNIALEALATPALASRPRPWMA
ncbi:MAG TPA: DoxX family membrane protein [Vicinamibacteria bacterium]|nr:DoxX family membrane protein [Vicinamibacteria bacterium]